MRENNRCNEVKLKDVWFSPEFFKDFLSGSSECLEGVESC